MEKVGLASRDKHRAAHQVVLERLIERRKALGLTQVELAARLHTEQSQISKFERRERRIDVIDFARLCRALELEPSAVLADLPLD